MYKYLIGTILMATVFSPLITQAATRDWRTWPFSQTSPWNMPIGSNAQYSAVDYSKVTGYGINVTDSTAAIAQGSASDPQVQVLTNTAYPATNWSYLYGGGAQCHTSVPPGTPVNNAGTYGKNPWSTTPTAPFHSPSQDWQPTIYLPASACPSPDWDGLMAVMQPNGWALDSYATLILSNGNIDGDQVTSFVNLKGDGTGYWNGRRASMLPSFAGLIRSGEIAGGNIPHALAVVVPPALLKAQAVWPAWAYDINNNYTGTLPMGTLLAIPPTVDVTKLGLSPTGLVIAHAAQDYGVYIVDRGGSGISYLAELNNPDLSNWAQASNDLSIITKRLEQVTNNSSTAIGGGGVPRVPLAPPFYDDATSTPAPTATLSANPVSILSGQSSTLSWSSANATSCTGTNFSTNSLTGGQVAVAPTQTITYTMTCAGAGGTSVPVSVTVTVSAPTPPPFAIGARVKTTVNLNVRSKANIGNGSKIKCTQLAGAFGTIASGPQSGSGYTWWNVNYDTSCDGWSVQNYLTTNLGGTTVAGGPYGDAMMPNQQAQAASASAATGNGALLAQLQAVAQQLLQLSESLGS